MKKIHKIVAAVAMLALGAAVVLPSSFAQAQSVNGLNNNLGDLFTLSALFGGGSAGAFAPQGVAVPVAVPGSVPYPSQNMNGSTSSDQNQMPGSTAVPSSGVVQPQPVPAVPVTGAYGGYPGVSLGSLLVLDQIFSNRSGTTVKSTSASTASNNNFASLGDLLILGQIFGGGYGYGGGYGLTGYGGGLLGGYGGGGLGNLFVLDKLFSNGSSGLFSGSLTSASSAGTVRSTSASTRSTISAPRSIINAPSSTINTGTPVTSTP